MSVMTKNIKILFLTWVLVLGCASALAKDLVRERAIFEDATGQLTLAQVKGAAFTAAPDVIYKGHSRSTFWVRLQLDVPAGQGLLSVRLRPTLLDTATLYYRNADSPSTDLALDMGARSAQQDSRVSLPPGPQTLYFRVATVGAVLIKSQVLTQDEAIAQDLSVQRELGAVLAIYALLVCMMVGLVLMLRDRLAYFFFFHLFICLALYVLAFNFFGETMPWAWATGKTATRLIVIVNFLSFALLIQAVLGYFDMPRAQRFARFCICCLALLVLLFWLGDTRLAIKLSAVVGAVTTLCLVTMLVYLIFRFSRDQDIHWSVRWIYGLVCSLFVAIVCRAMLHVLGVTQDGDFLLQSPAWRSIFIPLAMAGFLLHRDRVMRKASAQLVSARQLAEMQVFEKNRRLTTQSQFMAMLMHELKTPLYIIQLASASLSRHMAVGHQDTQRLHNIARALDDMNFIIDRCVLAEQLEQNDLPANKTPVALKTLLSEVKHIDGQERVRCTGVDQAKVVTDYQYARIILINLVTNALKYSPPDSLVQLTVEPAQGGAVPGLRVRVSNAVGSAGQPDPLQVFTRYYRAVAAQKQPGAGMGLWLAHTIASKLGTDLRCICDDERVHFEFILELS